MPLKVWEKIRQEFELKNPWWTYRRDSVKLPSGKNGEYHYVHAVGSSMIVPVLDDGRLLLVNQYRYLRERESLEFPCGGMKEGSTPEGTARLELAEETGFQAGELVQAGEFNPYNGVTDEICHVFIARDLTPARSSKDETEEFEYKYISPQEVDVLMSSGKIWDGMSLAAWILVRSSLL